MDSNDSITHMPRPETGPMQFPDDWPGLFIRGDNAMGMWINLKFLADKLKTELPDTGMNHMYLASLNKIVYLLASCDARKEPVCQLAQMFPTEVA